MSNAHFIKDDYYERRQSEHEERYGHGSPTFGPRRDELTQYIPSHLPYQTGESSVLSQIKQSRHASPSHSPVLHSRPDLQLKISPTSQYYDDMTATTSNFPMSSSNEDMSPTREKSPSKTGTKRDRSRLHTPRPSNSFILYRREKHMEIMGQYKGVKTLNNNVISKIVANMWRSETPEVKAHFAALADAEKRAHMLKYPDYKYRPRKSTSKKSPIKKLSVNISPGGEKYEDSLSPSVMSPDQYSPSHHVFQVMNPKPMGTYMAAPQYMQGNPYHGMQLASMDTHPRYEMMGEGFQLGNHHHEFMGHDSMLGEATAYESNWSMNPTGGAVWDLELDQKPFERMPK